MWPCRKMYMYYMTVFPSLSAYSQPSCETRCKNTIKRNKKSSAQPACQNRIVWTCQPFLHDLTMGQSCLMVRRIEQKMCLLWGFLLVIFMCRVNVVCLVCFERDYKDFDVRRENSHVLCQGTCLHSFFPSCSKWNFSSVLIDTLHSSCANNSEYKPKEQFTLEYFFPLFFPHFLARSAFISMINCLCLNEFC